MKRKYLSALLMGTLTVASMSTFTSCKDYDDDISNLQGQIDKLATADQLSQKVAELQALISSNKSDITSLQAKLADKTTLDEVKAVLADYATKQYVNDADKTLQDAIDALKTGDIAKLKEDVVKAQAAADKAAADAEKANADIVETLKTLATKTELKDAADAAQKAIEALESKNAEDLKKAQEAITETLKNYAEEGDKKTLESLAETIKNASDALTQANTNKQAIADALDILGKGYSKENTVAAAIEAIKGQIGTPNKELGTLDSRLAAIESVLNGVKDDDTKLGLATKVTNIENKLKDIIGQYSTMVTDVQLYNFAGYNGAVNGNVNGSSWGQVGDNGFVEGGIGGDIYEGSAASSVVPGWNTTLQFIQAAEKANVFPADAKAADKQLKFEEGKYYAGEDSLLIRVSPVDAELTTSNVSLMNSQGVELDDIINVTDVHRFKGLLTRASSANTGLWVVKFKATDLGDKFKEAAEVDSKKVLYAVAVKNTYNTTGEEKDANTRRVISEFGVDLSTSDAQHAWNFEVNGKSVAEIRNRYQFTETHTWTGNVPELVWKNGAATTVITENDDAAKINAADRYNNVDYRQGEDILAVEKGKPITIDFSNTELKGVKGFYVTLDEKFALESAPSELNAWNSYEYENVGYKGKPAKLFEGSKGTITIKDMNNVKGDIIGFRVYAVNYDGTLYDPDGRSFYVAVGDVKKELSLGNSKLTVNASNQFESTVVLPADFSKYDFNGQTGWKVTEEDADHKKPTAFTVKYLNDKGEEIALSKDVRSIKFILTDPQAFIDGATYNVSTTLTNRASSATAEVCTVNASFTKVMPDAAPAFCYRDGFTKSPEYIIPDNNSYEVATTNKGGKFDFRNILIINNNKEWNGEDLMDVTSNGKFKFNVTNGTYDADKKLAKAETENVNYILNVNNNGETNLVDNKTERTIAANYVYSAISKHYDAESKSYVATDYPVASKSTEKIVYCSWMKTFSYNVASKMEEKTIDGKKQKVETNTWLLNNTVEWKQTPGVAQTLDLNDLTTSIADVKLLPVAFPTGVSKVKFGEFLTNKVLAIVPHKNYGDIYTTDKAGNQINPYFSASISNNKITLNQISQSAIPSSVKEGAIHFTVKDCFGNTMSVVLPFTIKVNAVAAKKH